MPRITLKRVYVLICILVVWILVTNILPLLCPAGPNPQYEILDYNTKGGKEAIDIIESHQRLLYESSIQKLFILGSVLFVVIILILLDHFRDFLNDKQFRWAWRFAFIMLILFGAYFFTRDMYSGGWISKSIYSVAHTQINQLGYNIGELHYVKLRPDKYCLCVEYSIERAKDTIPISGMEIEITRNLLYPRRMWALPICGNQSDSGKRRARLKA